MSETEREILVREFPVELAANGDGRTIDARIVPYNVAALVADPPDYTPYQEMFLRGAFERQTNAASRVKVWLNFEHQQGLQGIIGHGLALADRADALYGSFSVHRTADGDKALQLVNDGVLTGLSVEFAALQSKVVRGVAQRVRAHIDKVSLCLAGKEAYKQAQVLAVRTEPVALEPMAPMDSALVERLAALGVTPLNRIAVVRRPWDGSASRFTDEQYQASCLIDRGGDAPVKQRCSLPVLEPDGALNVNALGAAAGRLTQVDAPADAKAFAARKLLRYYRLAQMEPPQGVQMMAAR